MSEGSTERPTHEIRHASGRRINIRNKRGGDAIRYKTYGSDRVSVGGHCTNPRLCLRGPLTMEVGKCVANLVHQLEVSDVEHVVPESVGLGVVRR